MRRTDLNRPFAADKRHSQANALAFFFGFLRRPTQVASVIPSSQILVQRVVRCCGVERARVVVELGPGTGVVTRGLLARMSPGARLVAVELMPHFAKMLARTISDPRLHVYRGAAHELMRALAQIGATHADVIVSGIPFTTLPPRIQASTLAAVRSGLGAGGRFVAYQVRDTVKRIAEPGFGPARIDKVLLNVPPNKVYTWELPATEAGAAAG